MRQRILLAITAVMVLSVLAVPAAYAQSEDDESGIMKKGVVHNIASDRRVERIGGVYQPEELDKYMKRRFDEIITRLAEIEARIDQLDGTLYEIKQTMEMKQKKSGTLVG